MEEYYRYFGIPKMVMKLGHAQALRFHRTRQQTTLKHTTTDQKTSLPPNKVLLHFITPFSPV